jgi:hypothetical protein
VGALPNGIAATAVAPLALVAMARGVGPPGGHGGADRGFGVETPWGAKTRSDARSALGPDRLEGRNRVCAPHTDRETGMTTPAARVAIFIERGPETKPGVAATTDYEASASKLTLPTV